MPKLNIFLPNPLQQFVEEQFVRMGFTSVSGYMRDLVSADQKRKAREQLELSPIPFVRSPSANFKKRKFISKKIRASRLRKASLTT